MRSTKVVVHLAVDLASHGSGVWSGPIYSSSIQPLNFTGLRTRYNMYFACTSKSHPVPTCV